MAVRITQAGAEVTTDTGGGSVRVTTLGAETAADYDGGAVRVTQVGVEVLMSNLSRAVVRAWLVG